MKSKSYILVSILLTLTLFFGYIYYVNLQESDYIEVVNALVKDKHDPEKMLQRLYETTPWEYDGDSYIEEVHYTYYSMSAKMKESNTKLKGKVDTYPNDVGSEENGYFSLTLVSKNNKELFKYEAYIIYD